MKRLITVIIFVFFGAGFSLAAIAKKKASEDPLFPTYLKLLQTGSLQEQLATIKLFGEYNSTDLPDALIQAYCDALDKDKPVELREAALLSLVELLNYKEVSVPKLTPLVLASLVGEEERLHHPASRALYRISRGVDLTVDQTDQFILALQSSNEQVVAGTLASISVANILNKKLLTTLVSLLDHSSRQVRERTVEALIEVSKDSSEVGDVIASHCIAELDPDTKYKMIWSLAYFPLTAQVNAALVASLNDQESRFRLGAVHTIAKMEEKAKPMIPELIGRVGAGDVDRAAASLALAGLAGVEKNSDVIPAVFKAFKKEKTPIKISLAIAILSWASGDKSEEIAVDEATDYYIEKMRAMSEDSERTSDFIDVLDHSSNVGPGASKFRLEFPSVIVNALKNQSDESFHSWILGESARVALKLDVIADTRPEDSIYLSLLKSEFEVQGASIDILWKPGEAAQPSSNYGDPNPRHLDLQNRLSMLLVALVADEMETEELRCTAAKIWQGQMMSLDNGYGKVELQAVAREKGSKLDVTILEVTK